MVDQVFRVYNTIGAVLLELTIDVVFMTPLYIEVDQRGDVELYESFFTVAYQPERTKKQSPFELWNPLKDSSKCIHDMTDEHGNAAF